MSAQRPGIKLKTIIKCKTLLYYKYQAICCISIC